MVLRYSSQTASRTDINPERDRHIPEWTHPVVKYYFDEWRLIRDAVEGEREVKDQRTLYLPKLSGMETDEYDDYLDRATYYNFTGRTLSALVGTLFRRRFRIDNLPDALEDRLETISKYGESLHVFAENAAEEFLAVGRFGTLVDLPAVESPAPKPYFVPYVTENILDWDTEVIDTSSGVEILTRVVLREWVLGNDTSTGAKKYYARYRVLALEGEFRADSTQAPSGPVVYTQTVYEVPNADAALNGPWKERTVPRIRGQALTNIPFALLASPRPPLLDIARLNISHFRTYAHLEHGRYYTGLPVYVAETPTPDDSDYYVGAATVWTMAPGSSAKILEFNGSGLTTLERALRDKEAQASSLGGRMVGVTPQSTAETDNQTALRDRNENALLHRTARQMDVFFTQLLRWAANFANALDWEDVTVLFNKSFMYDSIGSREFRAIQSMYKDGILPIEVVYEYMVKAGVIDEEVVDLEDLKTMLNRAESFPNNPDFQARKEGYPNAQTKVFDENADRKLDIEEKKVDGELEDADDDRESEEKKAETAAKAAAKAPPAGQPQPGGPPAAGGPPRGGPPAAGGPPVPGRRPPPRR
ncbi:MAG: DUF4055 domain-containing protein [Burkholderiaceae bacterium]